jgi:hypothetical protein
VALACAAGLLVPSGAGSAPFPPAPFDGHNPFNCELQYAGTGTDFPNPEADPFCVEFDKTQQNVTDFGLVEFLSLEPDRTAAASPKCFYFQHDHWTGSIVQGEQPEFWHWDGSYFFDKARGAGGIYVDNFRIGGQPADFGPYAPPEFQPYISPNGGGGMMSSLDIPPDPSCAAKVDTPLERRQVYYHRIRAGKVWRKRIVPVRLRTPRRAVLHRLGPAHERLEHTDRWDVIGGGQLRAAYRGSARDRRVAALLTTSPADSHRGIHAEDRVARARRALRARFVFAVGNDRVFESRRGRRARLFFGARRGKVRWLAIVHRSSVPGQRGVRRVLRALTAEPGTG